MSFGWCGPSIPALLSTESPLRTGPITKDESSWISSIFCIGLALGALFSGPMITRWGRIRLLTAMGPAQIAGWLLITFAQNVYYLYCSRFVMGFLGSAMFVVIPVFVAEIAHDSVRGSLGSIMPLFSNIGVFLAFLVAATLHFTIVSFVGLIFSVTYLVSLFFIPETPQYLTAINLHDKAGKSSDFYSGGVAISTEDRVEIDVDTKLGATTANEQHNDNKITLDDFRVTATRKAICISIVLMILTHLCGVLVILNYMPQIFSDASISIDPSYASCIVAGLLIVGSYISTVLVERLGRKFLIAASSFGTGLFLTMMGVYDFLKTGMQLDVSTYGWVPLLTLTGACFISSTGMNMLPYVVSAEVLPQKIRASVIGNCTVLRAIISFVHFHYFNWMINTFNMYGTMWLFSLFCCICTIYTLIVVPETKGRSFEEITRQLQSKN